MGHGLFVHVCPPPPRRCCQSRWPNAGDPVLDDELDDSSVSLNVGEVLKIYIYMKMI